MLDTYKIVVVTFLIIYWVNRIRFFKKTFLVTNVSSEIVLEILLFILSDTDIDFLD